MILIPIHTDQGYHAHIMENYGVGIRVDIATVTEEILQNAITTLINDKR